MASRLGPYVPLSANYADDDAILAVSAEAELLYIRCLAFAKRASSDGFLTEAQIKRAGHGITRIPQRVAELVTERLWLAEDSGYRIRAWLKWNASAEDIGRFRAGDAERKRELRKFREEVYARDEQMCVYCSSPDDLCLDHIRPRTLGGDHSVANLQTLCKDCNSRKGRRDGTGLSPSQARELFGITYGKVTGRSRDTSRESRTSPIQAGALARRHDTTRQDRNRSDGVVAVAPTGNNSRLAQQLATAYVERVPLSKFVAIQQIAKKALDAHYEPWQIESALLRLAADGRAVTIDALRIEMDGPPRSRPKESTTDQRVGAALALAAELRAEAGR